VVLVAAVTVVGLSSAIAVPEALAYDLQVTGGAPIASSTAGTPASAKVKGSVAGLGNRKPSLRFDIAAKGTFPITALTIQLPTGLFFSTRASGLAHGVAVAGTTKERSSVRHGLLTVTLPATSPRVELTVKGSALTESKALEATVGKLAQYNTAHKGSKRVLKLKLTVTVESGPLASIKVPVTFTFR